MTPETPAMMTEYKPDIGRPVIVGLLGAGIQLSRTPRMHEVEGAKLGLRYVYNFLDTDTATFEGKTVEDILWAVEACGYSGLNVTYPFKQAIIPHLDVLSDNASRLGAVNTVVFRDGKRMGHNTDLIGFAEGFKRNMKDAVTRRVLQLGAGGAGSAVARGLLQLGVHQLTISDISGSRAKVLADQLAGDFKSSEVRACTLTDIRDQSFDGLVNTTPVGMAKTPGMPVPRDMLGADMWVADIIYFPLETELLATARALGCRTLSGAPMAVFQAVRAFELFTGIAPDPEGMERTFNTFNSRGGRSEGGRSPDAAA